MSSQKPARCGKPGNIYVSSKTVIMKNINSINLCLFVMMYRSWFDFCVPVGWIRGHSCVVQWRCQRGRDPDAIETTNSIKFPSTYLIREFPAFNQIDFFFSCSGRNSICNPTVLWLRHWCPQFSLLQLLILAKNVVLNRLKLCLSCFSCIGTLSQKSSA